MAIFIAMLILLLSYLIGSIPFGLVLVRLFSGRDIRTVESGRTGGTNAFRAAGPWAGILTAVLDLLKAAATVWLARSIVPGNNWLEVLAPFCAILGHNYSVFLIERNERGRPRLRGGAGGAPTVGGAFGLWPPSVLIVLPLLALIFFGIGYASVTTLSAALLIALLFAFKALNNGFPWQYVLYGVLAELLVAWSLRPNIRRLIEGRERLVGWRARKLKKT
jgi:glycerol-3-phosphate acyltransferase PlsY